MLCLLVLFSRMTSLPGKQVNILAINQLRVVMTAGQQATIQCSIIITLKSNCCHRKHLTFFIGHNVFSNRIFTLWLIQFGHLFLVCSSCLIFDFCQQFNDLKNMATCLFRANRPTDISKRWEGGSVSITSNRPKYVLWRLWCMWECVGTTFQQTDRSPMVMVRVGGGC